MLQIQKISKQYKTESLTQQALDEVSLNLRDNEFVAILGPSGSGKTTLLNIIGGLDRYDSGDLIINGISTKNYTDRDWDSYRNHTIGFVFQSYNLIPHQTILSNVELALTISGVSKAERTSRAKQALVEVGLADHIHKRPNQLSGGQMQRVAIARALVNDPDILLADEPTGALDSTTSVQVMDLLKEVAKDRLVVMVTHNPELAEEYATRIVKLRDGKITDDSDPFELEENAKGGVHKNMGKSSMSLPTAFSLSLNNLLTKKGRTILTAFAGSIGIIGIALILSLSTGFQNYIDQIQEDTLTSYPLTLTGETADVTSALLQIATDVGSGEKDGVVKENQTISTMFSKVGKNDLKSFKEYLEDEEDFVDEYVSLIKYSYDIMPYIFIHNDQGITQVNPSTLMSSISGSSSSFMTSMSMMSGSSQIFYEMLDDEDALKNQYEVIEGKWPSKYNEMILVLNNPNSIADLLVYSLGLRDTNELKVMLSKIMAGEAVEKPGNPLEFTYEDLLNIEYKLIDATDTYRYNEKYDIYEDMSKDQEYMKNVYDQSETLKIVGIVVPKEGSTSMTLSTGVAYTKELTEHVINEASKSEIVKKQMENPEINIFSGKRFDEEEKDSGLDFQDLITVDTNALKSAFGGNFNQDEIGKLTEGYMSEISGAISADTSKAKELITETLNTLLKNMMNQTIEKYKTSLDVDPGESDIQSSINDWLSNLHQKYPEYTIDPDVLDKVFDSIKDKITNNTITSSLDMAYIPKNDISMIVNNYMASAYAQEKMAELSTKYALPASAYTEMFKGLLTGYFQVLQEINSGDNIVMMKSMVNSTVSLYMTMMDYSQTLDQVAIVVAEASMQTTIMTKVGELMGELVNSISSAMNVNPSKIASAFQFNLSEDELMRLMSTMSGGGVESNANNNLTLLGYQDIDEPSSISFYFKDFDSKEIFVNFLDEYNDKMEKKDDDKVIKYTDLTGILMSSMSVIVDSVTYVLIAFVSISLVVSSIMIGIITYISVVERTKEIGILRAIGASKKNISSIFNAETFMIGLCSGIIGIGVTLSLIPIINLVIHNVTGNYAINAVLPLIPGTILVILSVILTLIGGFIPSKQAALKDPVTALRSE